MAQTPPVQNSVPGYPTLAQTAGEHAAAMPSLPVVPAAAVEEESSDWPPHAEPGWQTTEFWITAGTELVAALTSFGVISQNTGQRITGLVVMGVGLGFYAISRGIRKQGTAG